MKKYALILGLLMTSAFAGNVDTKNSVVSWKGSKVTGDIHEGRVFIKSANVINSNKKFKNAEIVMDLTNFTVTDLKGEWAQKFLGHMKGKDFFNVGKYPTAKLEVTSLANGMATGNLTIKDKTHVVKFPMKKKSKKYVGKLKFDRTKFGMIYGSSNFFKNLGDKVIKNEVEIDFQIMVKG